ncbi:hypothetical protein EV200_103131 [Pedobacter psychrotolerans]|uniref:Uncharacterized protein n=1 Tax=Pedobacter psychrotolerans TaxID=1843235 RepID=A0A4R2HET0_9SPHI|nr:hypothetical protein [Pedobacter psychrotolerans]TCO26800.1 hypothetical protein EV200_103131 [Pedobacter psychrotolerans]GGE56614.1 hypothetical protein GCM10011413_23730 [Pedobacter psychrotolerans]
MEKVSSLSNSAAQDKIKLNIDHAIDFAPKPRSTRNYGITIKYYNDGKTEVAKRLDYQIHLKVNQFRDENKVWQLCFDKTDLFIDRHEPDFVGEQLANMGMGAIYPLKVDVNSRNEIFRGIVNHGEILNRWKQVAEKISDKYEGRYAELYLEKMEKKISDRFELEYALKADMFWNVFFHPQYLKYDGSLSRQSTLFFPVIAYKNVAFEGIQSVEPNYTDYGTFKVNFFSESELTEEQKIQMEQKGALKMKLNAAFDLDQNGGLLKHARVDWNLYKKENGEEMSAKRIVFSAYEIENSIPKTDQEALIQIEADNVASKKKKGFWASLLG